MQEQEEIIHDEDYKKNEYSIINKMLLYPSGIDIINREITTTIFETNNINMTRIHAPKNKPDNIFRLMTYNVHYWKDSHEKDSLYHIYTALTTMKPDIVCIQEAVFDNLLNTTINRFGYKIVTFCNNVPSWFNFPYGNMILISNSFHKKLASLGGDFFNLCSGSKCNLGQKNMTLPENCVSNPIDKYECITGETRCMIKIQLPLFDIICTHLDVENPLVRIKQLNHINSQIRRPTIICGDFNLINFHDFDENNSGANGKKFLQERIQNPRFTPSYKEYMYITKMLQWRDSFEITNKDPINYTVNTCVRTDFIFFAGNFDTINKTCKIIDTGVFFTNASDHLPVFVDIDNNDNAIEIIDDHYINRQYNTPISVGEFVNLYEMRRGIKLDGETMVDKMNNIHFYNGQKITDYKWFNDDGSVGENYVFTDPSHKYPSEYENRFNMGGIYGYLEKYLDASIISYQFTEEISTKYNKFTNVFDFKFNILSDNDIKILLVTDNYDNTFTGYNKNNDIEYDVIVLNNRELSEIKITNRLYNSVLRRHPLIQLNSHIISQRLHDFNNQNKEIQLSSTTNIKQKILEFLTDNEMPRSNDIIYMEYNDNLTEGTYIMFANGPFGNSFNEYLSNCVVTNIYDRISTLLQARQKYIKYKYKYLKLLANKNLQTK